MPNWAAHVKILIIDKISLLVSFHLHCTSLGSRDYIPLIINLKCLRIIYSINMKFKAYITLKIVHNSLSTLMDGGQFVTVKIVGSL